MHIALFARKLNVRRRGSSSISQGDKIPKHLIYT